MSTNNRIARSTVRVSGRGVRLLAATAVGTVIAGGIATPAFAATGVTAATGGTGMTAANAGPSASYTGLGAIVVNEGNAREISTGRFAVLAPAGFEFRTSSSVTIAPSESIGDSRPSLSASASCANPSRGGISVTATTSAVTFYVCVASTDDTTLTISGIGVRPTANTPVASGALYLDGAAGAVTVTGVTRGPGGTNFGTLVQNPGATTQLTVGLPAGVTAGVAQTASVAAKDAYGNPTPDYRGAVRFTSTDPAAGLPADHKFTPGDNGVRAFTGVTLKTAGARSVTVTDKATSSITGAASTVVAPATAAGLTVTGIPTPSGAGNPTSATVTVRDAYGNLATGYRGTVTATSTDAAATLPGAYAFTAADAGQHTFAGLVLRTAGNQSVSFGDGSLTGTQAPITVQPGSLHHLAVSPGTATIDAGAGRTYTAQARDASDNNLGDVTGTAEFAISPNGSCSANICTATIAGAYTVTATKSGASGTATLQVNPAAPIVTVALAPATIAADGAATSTATVTVVDRYGNARTADPVTLSTDGDASIGPVQNHGDGTYTAVVTASKAAGTQTITATNGSTSDATVLTQTAGPATVVTLVLSAPAIQADGLATTNATVTVTDANGNPLAGLPVTIGTDGDVTVSAVTDQGFGTYTATVTASTTPGTETLTASSGPVSTTAPLTELAPLTITAIGPDSRGQGAGGSAFGQSLTITGSGFTPGALADFGPGVTVKFTTYVDSAHLTAHVTVAPDASVGTRPVTVNVTDGRAASCAGCFTVTAGPTVSSLTPSTMGPGAQRTMTITGDHFAAGVKVTVPASGVAVTSVTVLDGQHLSVGFSTAFAAPAGPRDLTITNPADGGTTTCAGCLTITAGPVVTAVSPSVLGAGAQTTVTVTGANFADGARVSFAGTGVAVTTQSRVDATTIVATLSVAGSAVPGARTVNVVNGDGGRGSLGTGFSVNAAPSVTGIAAGSLARGATAQVTITGTNFAPGATVSLSSGVTVGNVSVVDANTITATVTVSATTGLGTRTVLVTNADFGKGTCGGCFRVG